MPSPAVTSVHVDDAGVRAASDSEVVLDVLFDGRRIWSFRLHRDGSRTNGDWHGVAGVAAPLPRRRDAAERGGARRPAGRLRRGGRLGTGVRPDRRGQRPWPAARHRQVPPPRPDLRHAQRRARRAAARLDRGGPRRAEEGRDRGLPGLRHPARRGAWRQAHRPRQRRRPGLRQRAHPPRRRDARVVPTSSARWPTWATGSPATAAPPSRSTCTRPTGRCAGSTCSAAS